MSNGSAFPLTASSLTTTSETPFIPGRSNIEFNKIPSKIDLNPLAPVYLSIAFSEIDESASLVNDSSIFSISNNL